MKTTLFFDFISDREAIVVLDTENDLEFEIDLLGIEKEVFNRLTKKREIVFPTFSDEEYDQMLAFLLSGNFDSVLKIENG